MNDPPLPVDSGRPDFTGESAALAGFRGKLELPALHGNPHSPSGAKLALQDLLGERILDALLDRALERARAVHRVIAGLAQVIAGRVVEHEFDVTFGQALAQVSELDVDDDPDLVRAERMEDDNVVEPVDELGPEVLLHDFEHGGL